MLINNKTSYHTFVIPIKNLSTLDKSKLVDLVKSPTFEKFYVTIGVSEHFTETSERFILNTIYVDDTITVVELS